MKNINQLLDMAGQSHQHLPALLMLLVSLVVLRRRHSLSFGDDEISGDNIPITLMESMGR